MANELLADEATLYVRIPGASHRTLKAWAARDGLTMAEMVVRLIDAHRDFPGRPHNSATKHDRKD